jgi:hypothetical protein
MSAAKAEKLAQIARAYAFRTERHIEHTGHTRRRLLEAVADLLGARTDAWALAELKALAAAVAPYARTPEHVEGLGPACERARRAIAKSEGRCSALRFANLPAPGRAVSQ